MLYGVVREIDQVPRVVRRMVKDKQRAIALCEKYDDAHVIDLYNNMIYVCQSLRDKYGS